jgi:hypothetical protein
MPRSHRGNGWGSGGRRVVVVSVEDQRMRRRRERRSVVIAGAHVGRHPGQSARGFGAMPQSTHTQAAGTVRWRWSSSRGEAVSRCDTPN